jgi:hypothetical protein
MLTPEDISALRRLMELREKRDEDKKQATESEKEFRDAEADWFEKLTDPETGNVRRIPPVDLGPPWGRVSFQARETAYGRIIPGKEAEALEYFRARQLVSEMTEPKVKKARLNDLVREALESGDGQMPPGIDFYHNRGVTITREKD